MPQPRDLTASIYKSKKFQTGDIAYRLSNFGPVGGLSSLRLRRVRFSTFSFAMGLVIAITLAGQVALMSLFAWL